MAKKVEAPTETPVEAVETGLVEVEYLVGEFSTSYYGNGFRVDFVDGKANVTEEIAALLKEAKLIK